MSEADEQKEIVKWFRETYPQYALSLRVSQSGAFRGKGRIGAIRTALLTSMGAVTGESDIAILLPRGKFGSLLLEHKADGSAHKATKDQIEYISQHNRMGNCACLTRGVEAAKIAIQGYIELGAPKYAE